MIGYGSWMSVRCDDRRREREGRCREKQEEEAEEENRRKGGRMGDNKGREKEKEEEGVSCHPHLDCHSPVIIVCGPCWSRTAARTLSCLPARPSRTHNDSMHVCCWALIVLIWSYRYSSLSDGMSVWYCTFIFLADCVRSGVPSTNNTFGHNFTCVHHQRTPIYFSFNHCQYISKTFPKAQRTGRFR